MSSNNRYAIIMMPHLSMGLLLILAIAGCERRPTLPPLSAADSALIPQENLTHGAAVDSFFCHDPASPFVRNTAIEYRGVRWYPMSLWFTDKTTGSETYNVGRYEDVGDEIPDQTHEYGIDFNTAYNPYCAYSGLYSCAVPRKEDRIDLAVRAGELKYHNDESHVIPTRP